MSEQGTQNQALEQTRDSVLRHCEPVGRELLNLIVRPTDRVSSIACGSSLTEALTRFLELIETPVVVGASTPRAGFSPFATT